MAYLGTQTKKLTVMPIKSGVTQKDKERDKLNKLKPAPGGAAVEPVAPAGAAETVAASKKAGAGE